MDLPAWALLALLWSLGSALATALAISYAHRRRMLDEPGGRRLHDRPTVRGAGIGAMLSLLTGLGILAWLSPGERISLAWAGGGFLLLMLTGYRDDHQALAARWRLAAQGLAGSMLVVAALPADSAATQALALLGTLWLVNLYNFIDGSDLFASSHGVLLGSVVAVLAGLSGDSMLAALGLGLAAALAGFVPFNWPPARAFMGDVASGPIGYWAALLLLFGWQRGSLDPLLVLVILSGLIADATLTLWLRARSGRRWYQAHRSHLYQWLRRRGWSALAVCAIYLLWATLVTSLYLVWPLHLGGGPAAFVLTYLLASILWLFARRFLLESSSRSSAA
jgi:Fuc2NAc and GlcNAc transferase